MLNVRDLEVFYGRAQVLFEVSFDVPAGQVTALMGRNGAGKSTTLKALMGLVPPVAGRIDLAGRRIDGWPPFRIARAGLGYVAEERRIFPDMTVAENLEVGRRPPADGRAPWTQADVERLFPNLAHLRHRRAGQTSGGEQQMLAVARTLMGNPRVLLLDEPSEGLAPVIVQQMAAAVRSLKAGGVTVLVSEQNLRFADSVADRAVVLEKGAVRFDGAMTALAEDDRLRRTYLAL
jgi:branched-chain amino acid transport system ATP-binding protein